MKTILIDSLNNQKIRAIKLGNNRNPKAPYQKDWNNDREINDLKEDSKYPINSEDNAIGIPFNQKYVNLVGIDIDIKDDNGLKEKKYKEIREVIESWGEDHKNNVKERSINNGFHFFYKIDDYEYLVKYLQDQFEINIDYDIGKKMLKCSDSKISVEIFWRTGQIAVYNDLNFNDLISWKNEYLENLSKLISIKKNGEKIRRTKIALKEQNSIQLEKVINNVKVLQMFESGAWDDIGGYKCVQKDILPLYQHYGQFDRFKSIISKFHKKFLSQWKNHRTFKISPLGKEWIKSIEQKEEDTFKERLFDLVEQIIIDYKLINVSENNENVFKCDFVSVAENKIKLLDFKTIESNYLKPLVFSEFEPVLRKKYSSYQQHVKNAFYTHKNYDETFKLNSKKNTETIIFGNGYLDLKKKKFISGKTKQYAFIHFDFDFPIKEVFLPDFDLIYSALKERWGEKITNAFLSQLVDIRSQYRFFTILKGKGNTGKTTFINFLAKCFYPYSEAIELETLSNERSNAKISSKMLIYGNEIENEWSIKDKKLKTIIENQETQIKPLYKNEYSILPICCLIYATNHEINLSKLSLDDGMVRRTFFVSWNKPLFETNRPEWYDVCNDIPIEIKKQFIIGCCWLLINQKEYNYQNSIRRDPLNIFASEIRRQNSTNIFINAVLNNEINDIELETLKLVNKKLVNKKLVKRSLLYDCYILYVKRLQLVKKNRNTFYKEVEELLGEPERKMDNYCYNLNNGENKKGRNETNN